MKCLPASCECQIRPDVEYCSQECERAHPNILELPVNAIMANV
jgi:hypothetical protein